MFDIFLKLQATTGENGGIQNGENIPVHLKHSYWTALLGITMGLLSGVSLAISDVFVMLCIKIGYSPSQVLLVKSLMIVAITIPLLIYKGINILKLKKKDAILNIVKGFSENGACLVYYYAMDGIGMGDTAAITVGTLPIFAPMFACIFIKEKCKLHDCVSVVINVAGIILVSRPQFIFADVIVFHKQVVNLEIIGAFLVILSSVIVFVFVCFETKQSVSEETKLVQKPK
uniref:Solute carrier family 35 member G1-like n=1 Tax=Saccoglossus kowalevskii TaxID=10224 RepID=A0ABM0MAS9_SACKO|nr:PREDICTED: solute carrier family 35 member G1-like [Saccoglossus kowalevskii]